MKLLSSILLAVLPAVTKALVEDRSILARGIPPEEAAALAGIVEDEPAPPTPVTAAKGGSKDLSPKYNLIYKVPLPIPPVKEPLMTITNPVTGKDILYYEVEIKSFQQQVYPNLGPATLVGYDGMAPGPTFIMEKGQESIVRFVNNAKKPNSVHLHGSYSRAAFDGWAEDTTKPGEYKDYYYPNSQSARLLWYHDHAIHITAENAYMGQAGAYIIHDPAENALNLPSGYGEFDIPLILTSKQYNSDGSLHSTDGETDSLWGDVIHVNGQPWPFLNVQPRKYRFRFLNAAVSRSFALYFAKSTATTKKLPFQVIASDAGLLTDAASKNQLWISMAERYEVVVDFAPYAGQSIDLRNLADVGDVGADEDYDNTDKVMRFVVASGSVSDPSTVPASLRTVPFPEHGGDVDHHFRFHRSNGEWQINGVTFSDKENRVLANVRRGKVEVWELENKSGGWTHPIHVHLVDFRVLKREGGDRQVQSYESKGLKDVVWLAKNEMVTVEAHYSPWDGLYMFHCHNLIHEDHDMMGAFNVTQLQGFGYNQDIFLDPMEEEWRPRPYKIKDFEDRTGPFTQEAITERVQEMAEADPYSKKEAVEEALDEYWDTHSKAKRVEHPIPRYRRSL